jgi:hypothetical protein
MMEQAIKESIGGVAAVGEEKVAVAELVKDENKMLDDLLDDLIKDEGDY